MTDTELFVRHLRDLTGDDRYRRWMARLAYRQEREFPGEPQGSRVSKGIRSENSSLREDAAARTIVARVTLPNHARI